MPFGASRAVNSVKKEVLKFATGLEAIESVTLAASEADTLTSAVVGYEGKLGLLAGTILTKIPNDDLGRYKKFEDESNEEIAGILGDNIYFYTDGDESDEPADMLFHSCVFNKAKIIGFDDYETELRAALNTCRFEDHYDSNGDVIE